MPLEQTKDIKRCKKCGSRNVVITEDYNMIDGNSTKKVNKFNANNSNEINTTVPYVVKKRFFWLDLIIL